jgi:hypothetical protein
MSKYLNQWRQALEATEEISLSIGPAVIKCHVSLLDLAAAGRIPATLLTELESLGRKAQKDATRAGTEGLAKMGPALDAVAIAAFIDPPVSRDGGEESLPVAAIPFADKLAVFMRVNQEAAALQPFRLGERQSNGAAHPGDGVPLPAVGDSGAG